jgi:hypothetical protein
LTPLTNKPQSIIARENSPAAVMPNVSSEEFIIEPHELHGAFTWFGIESVGCFKKHSCVSG